MRIYVCVFVSAKLAHYLMHTVPYARTRTHTHISDLQTLANFNIQAFILIYIHAVMTVCHANPMLATLDSYVSYSVVSCGQSTYTHRRRNRGGEKAASGYMYGEDSCSEEEEDDGRGNDEDEDKERGEDEKEALSRRHF